MSAKIDDVMTSEVVTIRPETPFKTIAELLAAYRVGAVPVVDPDGRVAGVVSQSDLLLKEDRPHAASPHRLLESRRRRAERIKAGGRTAADVMTAPGVTVGLGASVAEAARLMRDRKVHHLPVVGDDGRLAGIVSRGDLVRVFVRSDESIRTEILEDVLLRHLMTDPARVDVKVTDGLVSLRGQLESRSLVSLLVRLVEELDGVVAVDHELRWDWDDTRRTDDASRPPLGV